MDLSEDEYKATYRMYNRCKYLKERVCTNGNCKLCGDFAECDKCEFYEK